MSLKQSSIRISGMMFFMLANSACVIPPGESPFFDTTSRDGIRSVCIKSSVGLIASGRSNSSISGNGAIKGDALFMDGSAVTFSGNASVSGKAYVVDASLFHKAGKAKIGGVEVRDLSREQSLLELFALNLADMKSTQEFAELRGSHVIHGNGGTNVVVVKGDIVLSGGDTLLLSGSSSDIFVINVHGGVSLSGHGRIMVSGGARDQNVVLNSIGAGRDLSISGQGSISGTFLGMRRGAQIAGGGTLKGALIVGEGVQISGNGLTVNPAPFCIDVGPEPTPSPSPSVEPSPSPSVEPSPSPSVEPSPSPSVEPTPSPSVEPSPSPSVEPSPSPSVEPSPSPSVEPTPSPSVEPTPSPSPSSSPCADFICGGGLIGV